MSRLPSLLLLCGLLGVSVGCEHNEHPFEVWWSTSCAANTQHTMTTHFDKDFWLDDRGKRRRYQGEVRIHLDAELWDSWLVTVDVNPSDGTAETTELVHVPIPDGFADAYDLKPLTFDLATFEEDEEETWARMTGTCGWGDERGELALSMADDCDACLECSTVGLAPPAFMVLLPVLIGLSMRRREDED